MIVLSNSRNELVNAEKKLGGTCDVLQHGCFTDRIHPQDGDGNPLRFTTIVPLTMRVTTIAVGECDYTPVNEDLIRDESQYRIVSLRLEYNDNEYVEAVRAFHVQRLAESRAELGGCVWIDLPETGMSGWALVTAIEPCPTIKPGPGRLVLGRYKYSAGVVFDLRVDGEEYAIEVTGSHPFWSVDRQAWVSVRNARIGERLLG